MIYNKTPQEENPCHRFVFSVGHKKGGMATSEGETAYRARKKGENGLSLRQGPMAEQS